MVYRLVIGQYSQSQTLKCINTDTTMKLSEKSMVPRTKKRENKMQKKKVYFDKKSS